MMEFFTKEPDELWIVFSFVVFLLVIWFKGRKAIFASLDRKIAEIRAEVDAAQTLRTEAQALFEDYEHKHAEAMREAEYVVRTAEKQAAEMRKKAETDLAQSLEQRERQLQERLNRMRDSAIEDMRKYAADLAMEATAGIIGEKLDKAARDRLIDQAVKSIGKNIH